MMSGGLSPKKKMSRSRTRSRRAANSKLLAPTYARCPHCSQPKQPHLVCGNCGWYQGREAVEVD
jgi:large subunit ribosomal protein L32